MLSGRKRKADAAYSGRNSVQLIRGGKAYFDLVEALINRSRKSLHFQTYIFEEDETGRQLASALAAAARRGVQVYLLLDGYGSQNLSRHFLKELEEAGVFFRWFEPLLRGRSYYFGRRMHHKVMVADGSAGVVGGINVSDRYNDRPGAPAWLDWALYVQGEAARELLYRCWDFWNRADLKPHPVLEDLPAYQLNAPFSQCLVRLRINDWVNRKIQINRSYQEMFKKARSHIYLMSSYFLPGNLFRRSLVAAARRGVAIRIIVAGKSDVPMARHAERYVWRWLLRNGMEIYEYEPTVLHAKLSTYDGKWMTVGSYNLNNISAYASIELNLDVLDDNFVSDVESRISEIIRFDCVKITEKEFEQHNHLHKRVWQWICYQLIRIIFKLFTFYFRQHDEDFHYQ